MKKSDLIFLIFLLALAITGINSIYKSQIASSGTVLYADEIMVDIYGNPVTPKYFPEKEVPPPLPISSKVININTAPLEKLMELDGIGEITAKK
ncbi:MAG: hypothetical protein RSE93_04080 [Oscillospiraceae bacterium]